MSKMFNCLCKKKDGDTRKTEKCTKENKDKKHICYPIGHEFPNAKSKKNAMMKTKKVGTDKKCGYPMEKENDLSILSKRLYESSSNKLKPVMENGVDEDTNLTLTPTYTIKNKKSTPKTPKNFYSDIELQVNIQDGEKDVNSDNDSINVFDEPISETISQLPSKQTDLTPKLKEDQEKKLGVQNLPSINIRPTLDVVQTLQLSISEEGHSKNNINNFDNIIYVEVEGVKEVRAISNTVLPLRKSTTYEFPIIASEVSAVGHLSRTTSCGCLHKTFNSEPCKCEIMENEILDLNSAKVKKNTTCNCNHNLDNATIIPIEILNKMFEAKENIAENLSIIKQQIMKNSSKLNEDFSDLHCDSIIALYKSFQLVGSSKLHEPEPLNEDAALKLTQMDEFVYKSFVNPQGIPVCNEDEDEDRDEKKRKRIEMLREIPHGFYICQASQCNLIIDQCLEKHDSKKSSHIKLISGSGTPIENPKISNTSMKSKPANEEVCRLKKSNITIPPIKNYPPQNEENISVIENEIGVISLEENKTDNINNQIKCAMKTDMHGSKTEYPVFRISDISVSSAGVQDIASNKIVPEKDHKNSVIMDQKKIDFKSSEISKKMDNESFRSTDLLNDQYIQDKIDSKLNRIKENLKSDESVEVDEISISISYSTEETESIHVPEMFAKKQPEISIDVTIVEKDPIVEKKAEPPPKPKKYFEKLKTKKPKPEKKQIEEKVSDLGGHLKCFKRKKFKSRVDNRSLSQFSNESLVAVENLEEETMKYETDELIDLQSSELTRVFKKALEDIRKSGNITDSAMDEGFKKEEQFTKVLTERHTEVAPSANVIDTFKKKRSSGIFNYNTLLDDDHLTNRSQVKKPDQNKIQSNYTALIGNQNYKFLSKNRKIFKDEAKLNQHSPKQKGDSSEGSDLLNFTENSSKKEPKLRSLFSTNKSSTSNSRSLSSKIEQNKFKLPQDDSQLLSEGEKLCNCSVSSGELHMCSEISPFRKKYMNETRKKPEPNLQHTKAMHNHWISCYVKDKHNYNPGGKRDSKNN